MASDLTKAVRVPLSQDTIGELRVSASKLREMAATARNAVDIQALETLGRRFETLAELRAVEDDEGRKAADALALRLTENEQLGAKYYVPARNAGTPLGAPSVEALRMATDAICRHYVWPETKQHPMVRSECTSLAYDLMAYGLVPEKAHQAPRAVVTELPHGTGIPDNARRTAHRILVVDDVADVLVTVGAFLVNAGFAVRKAANGDEALRVIASDPDIDVLVTDFAMPGLSGVDLISQAVQARPNLRAMVITGYPNADGLAELPPHTVILVKPFRRDALIAGVKSLLGETQPVANDTMELIDQTRIDLARG